MNFLSLWSKQESRKVCLGVLNEYYKDAVLMTDRRGSKMYYSIWRAGQSLIEVLREEKPGGKISVYEYRAV